MKRRTLAAAVAAIVLVTAAACAPRQTPDQIGEAIWAEHEAREKAKYAKWKAEEPERQRKEQEQSVRMYRDAAAMQAQTEAVIAKAVGTREAAIAWGKCVGDAAARIDLATFEPPTSVAAAAFAVCQKYEVDFTQKWRMAAGFEEAQRQAASVRSTLTSGMLSSIVQRRAKAAAAAALPVPPQPAGKPI